MSSYDIQNDRLIVAFEELQREGSTQGAWGLGGTNLPFGDVLESRFPLVGRFLDEQGQVAVSQMSPHQVVNVLADVFD